MTEKNPHAVALGRLGGLKGGPARMRKLDQFQRARLSREGGYARWHYKLSKDTITFNITIIKDAQRSFRTVEGWQVTLLQFPTLQLALHRVGEWDGTSEGHYRVTELVTGLSLATREYAVDAIKDTESIITRKGLAKAEEIIASQPKVPAVQPRE